MRKLLVAFVTAAVLTGGAVAAQARHPPMSVSTSIGIVSGQGVSVSTATPGGATTTSIETTSASGQGNVLGTGATSFGGMANIAVGSSALSSLQSALSLASSQVVTGGFGVSLSVALPGGHTTTLSKEATLSMGQGKVLGTGSTSFSGTSGISVGTSAGN